MQQVNRLPRNTANPWKITNLESVLIPKNENFTSIWKFSHLKVRKFSPSTWGWAHFQTKKQRFIVRVNYISGIGKNRIWKQITLWMKKLQNLQSKFWSFYNKTPISTNNAIVKLWHKNCCRNIHHLDFLKPAKPPSIANFLKVILETI